MRTKFDARRRGLGWLGVVAAALVLLGCSSPRQKAPVEDRRSPAKSTASQSAGLKAGAQAALPAGSENAGKPSYYTVRPQDTLVRIALDNGQNWKDLARWNGLENPNLIEVGQVLRVVPPGADASQPSTRPVTVAKVETRPLDSKTADSSASQPAARWGCRHRDRQGGWCAHAAPNGLGPGHCGDRFGIPAPAAGLFPGH